MMFGSSGSLRVWKPSPPATMNQSLVRTPHRFVERDGPAERPVVLRAAADVVERLRVVHRHAVELRNRQVGEEPPRRAFVVRFVQPAVVGQEHVAPVRRIERQVVVINMDVETIAAVVLPVGASPRLAAVGAALHIDVHRVDRVGPVRVDEDLVVVLRAAAAVPVVDGRRSSRCRLRRGAGRTLCRSAAGAACPSAGRRRGLRSGRWRRGSPAASGRAATARRRWHVADARPRRAAVIRAVETRLVALRVHDGEDRWPASCGRRWRTRRGPCRPSAAPWSVSSTSCPRWSS